jgi:asparagine synthase (glutamine-hydrolysing)
MGGLVGIIGDGSLAEVEAMAARMPYRGMAHCWSPSHEVFLGEVDRDHACVKHDQGCFAIDAPGDSPARERIESDITRRGDGAIADLRGFFAIARWNPREQTLTLACDRHGYKTLYIAELPGRIAFASDYKALLALSDLAARVDRDVLQTYLMSRSFSSEQTLLATVKPIGGANLWTTGRDLKVRREPYWQPRERGAGERRTFAEAARELRRLLLWTMRRQLNGRKRIAIALSGGLDSVAVLALAKHVRPDIEIASYTIGHSEEDPEIVRAREAAEHFGTVHRELFLPPAKVPEQIERLVWLTEDLTGREEAVLQQVLAEEMSGRENDYLAGHGADADFAGMPRHRLMWLRDHAPRPLRGALNELFVYTQRRQAPKSWLGRRLASFAYHGDTPDVPTVLGAQPTPAIDCPSLSDYCRSTITWLDTMRFHEPVEAACDVTMITPFFDFTVVDFALTCPTSFLIDARQQKRILRAAVRELMPVQLSQRRKLIQRMKHDLQLSEVLDDFANQLRLRGSLAERGLVPADYLRRLQQRDARAAYSSERLHILWALISAELWLRQFIDQRGTPDPGRLAMARPARMAAATPRVSHPAPMP